MDLQTEMAYVLNRFSQENQSNTPDFVLAQYLLDCLAAYNRAVKRSSEWHGQPTTGQPTTK